MKSMRQYLVLALATLSGCALVSKGQVNEVRWFSPETSHVTLTSAGALVRERSSGEAPPDAGTLELGRVASGSHLREKIAYRETPYEVGYHEDERWTERPEAYVRRRVARALFEERGVRRAVAGEGPTLDVEVQAFEEVKGAPPRARIQLHVVLHDEEHALLEQTLLVECPVSPPPGPGSKPRIEDLVRAMAEALDAVSEEVAALAITAARAAHR
jgi:ABC-type uncharacterized transport system auxiliary subunit